MNRIRILIRCGVFLVVSFLLPLQATGTETIKIGFFEHKPHQYKIDTENKPRGATILFFDMIAKKMGYEVKWIGPLPMFRLLGYLEHGVIDGTAHLVKIPELDKFVYYSNQPFHYAQPIFVVRKDNPLEKITTIEDIQGYRVGWLGTADKFPPSPFVQENMNRLHIEVIRGTKMWEQQLNKLLIGRIDAVHDLNAYTLMFEAKRIKIDRQVKILPLPEAPMPVFVMFSRQTQKGEILVKQYNKVFSEIQFTPEDYYKMVDEEFSSISKEE